MQSFTHHTYNLSVKRKNYRPWRVMHKEVSNNEDISYNALQALYESMKGTGNFMIAVQPPSDRCNGVGNFINGGPCYESVIPGINFCRGCCQKVDRKLIKRIPIPKITYFPQKWIIRITSGALTIYAELLDKQIATDIILVATDDIEFPVHKLILIAASPYFLTLLTGNMSSMINNKVHLSVPSAILRNYISLLYGKEIIVEKDADWRIAFDLYDYLDATLINWTRDDVITNITIPSSDYTEYIKRLERLYHSDIPRDIIKKTQRFVDETTDLSAFEEDFVEIVRPSDEEFIDELLRDVL